MLAISNENHSQTQLEAIHALWRTGILCWKLWPQQEIIYDCIRDLDPKVVEAVVLCARQFGKSVLGTLLALEDCLQNQEKCILVMGPTLKQTMAIVTPRIRLLSRDAPVGLIKPSKSEGKWFVGSSELVIGGMDVNSSAQRGKTVQSVYIEEIVESKPDQYIESLRSDIGPALTHSENGKVIFLTTPPKIPDHPFITETMAQARLNNALYTYTIDDNKALSPSQYEACVRRAGGKNSIDFRREYLCEIIRDQSIVIIPDYDEKQHVSFFELPEMINLEIFTDWGGVRDKTVSLLVGYSFLEDRDLVFDELVWNHNTPTDVIVNDLRSKWGSYKIKSHYVDAPGQLQVDLKTTHDLSVRFPSKSEWRTSVNHLANRFTQKKIVIHPRCKFLRETCRSGTFRANRTDFERSHTLGHMDAIAALMYAVRQMDRSNPFGKFEKPRADWQPIPENPLAALRPKVKR